MTGPARPSTRHVLWHPGPSAGVPYEAEVEGRRWQVQVNDFPAEALYTLLIEGTPAEQLEAWPETWIRPAPR
ncbi:hypothetical protein [Melittangium boletus]|uniref:hypothetical protein n=1 Tax=Melittangium boletus TaxID=83453 RepID=UPI003DA4CFF5